MAAFTFGRGRNFLATLQSAAMSTANPAPGVAQGLVRLDYAYYSPLSLALKEKHWVEDALGPEVTVEWVLSAGGNKALEYLGARSIDLGSTAGSAALLGRANHELETADAGPVRGHFRVE
jgi:sulfonate transport system substrate-binding protein